MKELPQRLPGPQVHVESFLPVVVFLGPCRVDRMKLKELEARTETPHYKGSAATELRELVVEPFEEECLGLRVHIQPKLFIVPGLEWAALALICELAPQGLSPFAFEQLLAFNSNFRFCQGEPERQDTPTPAYPTVEFQLSSGRRPAEIYEQVARSTIGYYEPPQNLKKAITLSFGQFESELSDQELYLLGTIGHPDEVAEPAWASSAVQRQAFDRWRCLGWRFFVHSYSLVCACATNEAAEGGKGTNPRKGIATSLIH